MIFVSMIGNDEMIMEWHYITHMGYVHGGKCDESDVSHKISTFIGMNSSFSKRYAKVNPNILEMSN